MWREEPCTRISQLRMPCAWFRIDSNLEIESREVMTRAISVSGNPNANILYPIILI